MIHKGLQHSQSINAGNSSLPCFLSDATAFHCKRSKLLTRDPGNRKKDMVYLLP
jgi:hypothetical protein